MAGFIYYILTLYTVYAAGNEINKPNIMFMVGDDMGWDDISLHGSDQILTPNIDMIGYQGIIIPNYYTDCQGTPSRSAMFTGKYPMRMGTQGSSIGATEDRGIPISERLLPSYLKDLGYVSHLVGKWQLGKSREHYLPTKRGFDTFYGFTEGSVDYYTYNHVEVVNGTELYGLDLFNNLEPVRDQGGHLTDILTNHAVKLIEEHDTSTPMYLHVSHAAAHIGGGLVSLQAPYEDVMANKHIAHSARRFFAALVTGVDRSLGKIVDALAKKGMLHNTIIIFVSDNGASSIGSLRNYGSNLPLRGTKGTPWEGAVRSNAVLWHAGVNPKVWDGLFHVTDWLPTLVAAAGANETENLDGVNHWDSLFNDTEPKRNHAVIAVDDLQEWGAFRDGDFKIIIGNVPNTCGYYGQELSKVTDGAPVYEDTLLECQTSKTFRDSLEIGLDVAYALEKRDLCNLNKRKIEQNITAIESKEFCVPTKVKGCLFNISADPEETQDLWEMLPDIVLHMTLRFRLLWPELVPRRPPVFDIRADPGNHSYVWYPWLEDDVESPAPVTVASQYPLLMTPGELDYFVKMNLQVFTDRLNGYFRSLADTFVSSVSSIFV